MKSGTSTLSYHLSQHPDIFMADHEIHFFNNEKHYSKGLDWYANEFSGYQNQSIIGEKTPNYCLKKEYAENIAKIIPSAKLIWILRNPIDRAYSDYWHAYKKGRENRAFKEVIEEEMKYIELGKLEGYLYRSLYFMHVEYFLHFFPKKQMFFTTFEEYTKDFNSTQKILRDIFVFLGINPDIEIDVSIKKNVTVLPKNQKIQKIIDRITKFGKPFFKNGGQVAQLYHKMIAFNYKKEVGYPSMDLETVSNLQKFFKNPNQKLSKIVNINTSFWN